MTDSEIDEALVEMVKQGMACAFFDNGKLRFVASQYLTPEIIMSSMTAEQVATFMRSVPDETVKTG